MTYNKRSERLPKWAFGLVVWFSLRVREVPSSILGMPHFSFIFYNFKGEKAGGNCLQHLYFLYDQAEVTSFDLYQLQKYTWRKKRLSLVIWNYIKADLVPTRCKLITMYGGRPMTKTIWQSNFTTKLNNLINFSTPQYILYIYLKHT